MSAALRAIQAKGRPLTGLLVASGAETWVEMAGLAGFDFALIDAEHGPGDHALLLRLLRAASAGGIPALLRLPGFDRHLAGLALDMGFAGLLLPAVRDAAEARAFVDACTFPPHGSRGVGAYLARGSGYGTRAAAYLQAEAPFLGVMIESARAVDQVAAIAAIDGIDTLVIGGYDLSGAYGRPGDWANPAYGAALAAIRNAARAAGKTLGGAAGGQMTPAELVSAGYGFVVAGSDIGLMREGCQRLRATVAECPA